jgi:hypothetical protein
MDYSTRPSNVRVYQFRQPPGCAASRLDGRVGARVRMILPKVSQTGGWYPLQDSNSQPPDPKSGALSIELSGRSNCAPDLQTRVQGAPNPKGKPDATERKAYASPKRMGLLDTVVQAVVVAAVLAVGGLLRPGRFA